MKASINNKDNKHRQVPSDQLHVRHQRSPVREGSVGDREVRPDEGGFSEVGDEEVCRGGSHRPRTSTSSRSSASTRIIFLQTVCFTFEMLMFHDVLFCVCSCYVCLCCTFESVINLSFRVA